MAGKLKGKFAPSEIKKHVLTAISYLLPLIVASGLLIAIGNLTGGVNIASIDELDAMTVPSALTTLGVMGMGLIRHSSAATSPTPLPTVPASRPASSWA